MGTRGAIGVRVNGKTKKHYNHWDSYPSGLGIAFLQDVLKLLKKLGQEKIAKKAEELKEFPDREATDEEVERYRQYADEGVGSRDIHDFYVLLRETQGDLEAMLETGFHESVDAGIEYEYIWDLDRNCIHFHDHNEGVNERIPMEDIESTMTRWST